MIERIIEASSRKIFLVLLSVFLLAAWGFWALNRVPLDAIPDLSDVQVIIFTEWPGRSPDIIEDQITYPIVSSMTSAPRVKFVRGLSYLGVSYVYAVFEDGTDIYWSRSRTIEYLNKIRGRLPEGATSSLGPDATGVAWVYQYALIDKTGGHDLHELRSLQDWSLKYWLESVPGVAEVATVGGFVKQYQVTLDPDRLLAHNLSVNAVISSIRRSNNDVGGRVVELAGTEYMVRGRGYIKDLEDIRKISLGVDDNGTPVLLRNVADVHLGPDIRRGIAELNGEGEVVGGIVVMRYGENALDVIKRVKEKIEESRQSLPPGVEIVTTYDRSSLINRAIDTLREKLVEEIIIVSLICVLFLFHVRSALVAIAVLPVAVLLSFIPMLYMNITSSIMSLGGIAIAIGAMVDAAIVMIENAHKHLEKSGGKNRVNALVTAAKEVGKPLFFSLLIITISFIPVFSLEAQEGRLFKPLAFTKTFAMFFSALLSITLVPALMVLLIRGKITPEARNPVNRLLTYLYRPLLRLFLRFKKSAIFLSVLAVTLVLPVFGKMGSEFMPPLNEGTMLYMPTSLPGLSITEAGRILGAQNRILKNTPEVETVFGKIGRANTATDPAPLNMVETILTFKPESQWRPGMTWEKLIQEMDKKLQVPGMPNIWWMPIQTRTEMLATGIRTALGIKILGPDLDTIQKLGIEMEPVIRKIPGTRSVYAERVVGGYFIDFVIDRDAIARHGLTVGDVEDVIETAIGGKNISFTIEGRERYPINVRYKRELRDDMEMLGRVLVNAPTGAQIPMKQLAEIKIVSGPPMIRDENGSLAGFVFVDITGRDLGRYVKEAKEAVKANIKLPPGYHLVWAGQYQYMERVKEKLKLVVPFTLLIIFMLLYLNFESVTKTLIVLLSVPFSLIGGILAVNYLGYNLSVAVWVGFIALAGVASEIGVIMITYLDYADAKRISSGSDNVLQAVEEGAGKRVRPIMMTVCAIIGGLMPIMWSHGTGADVMKRIAAPMIGGMVTATIMTLLVIPCVYLIWKEYREKKIKRSHTG